MCRCEKKICKYACFKYKVNVVNLNVSSILVVPFYGLFSDRGY